MEKLLKEMNLHHGKLFPEFFYKEGRDEGNWALHLIEDEIKKRGKDIVHLEKYEWWIVFDRQKISQDDYYMFLTIPAKSVGKIIGQNGEVIKYISQKIVEYYKTIFPNYNNKMSLILKPYFTLDDIPYDIVSKHGDAVYVVKKKIQDKDKIEQYLSTFKSVVGRVFYEKFLQKNQTVMLFYFLNRKPVGYFIRSNKWKEGEYDLSWHSKVLKIESN